MTGRAWTGVLAVEGAWAKSGTLVLAPGAVSWGTREELPVTLAGELVGSIGRNGVRRAGGLICAKGVLQGDPLVMPQGLAAVLDSVPEGPTVTSARLVGARLTDEPEWPVCWLVYRDALR